jgi:hypothetical protein
LMGAMPRAISCSADSSMMPADAMVAALCVRLLWRRPRCRCCVLLCCAATL